MNLEIEVSWKIWFKIDSVKDTLLCDSFSITIKEDIHLRQKTGVELRFWPRIGLDETQNRIGRKSSG